MQVQLLGNELVWTTIRKLARKAHSRHVAVAYFGKGASKLLPLRSGDSLVVDMSEASVKQGQTDPREVEKLLKKNVRVFTCSNLHAKVYVFDNNVVIGSANASQHSERALIEAAALVRDAAVAGQARGLIKDLQFEPVTPALLRTRKKQYQPPMFMGPPRRGDSKTPAHSRLWLVGVTSLELSGQEKDLCRQQEKTAKVKLRARVAKEKKRVSDFDITWLRFIGKTRFTETVREGERLSARAHFSHCSLQVIR